MTSPFSNILIIPKADYEHRLYKYGGTDQQFRFERYKKLACSDELDDSFGAHVIRESQRRARFYAISADKIFISELRIQKRACGFGLVAMDVCGNIWLSITEVNSLAEINGYIAKLHARGYLDRKRWTLITKSKELDDSLIL